MICRLLLFYHKFNGKRRDGREAERGTREEGGAREEMGYAVEGWEEGNENEFRD